MYRFVLQAFEKWVGFDWTRKIDWKEYLRYFYTTNVSYGQPSNATLDCEKWMHDDKHTWLELRDHHELYNFL